MEEEEIEGRRKKQKRRSRKGAVQHKPTMDGQRVVALWILTGSLFVRAENTVDAVQNVQLLRFALIQ
jgi:hypothetical protein